MSTDIYTFKNMSGEDAFITGVTEVLCEEKITKHIKGNYTVVADIIHMNTNDIEDFSKALKNKLSLYAENESMIKNKEIQNISLALEEIKGTTQIDATNEFIGNFIETTKLKEQVKDFYFCLEWYIGKPIGIWKICQNGSKLGEVFTSCYLYIIVDILLIQYDDYMLMLILGTDD